MIDPVMLGVVGVAVIGLITVLAFFFSSKDEEDFEKAFKDGALKLLSEAEPKKEKKAKKKDAKKTDKIKQDLKKDDGIAKKELETKDKEPVHQEAMKKTVEKPVEVSVKPTAVNKVEEVMTKQNIDLTTTQNDKEKVNNKQEKKKAPKPVKDIDNKKLISRLSREENLESDYVRYLEKYFRETDLQKNNLKDEVKAAMRKLNDSYQKVEKLNKEKTNFENKHKEEGAKIAALNTKIGELLKSESELKKSMVALTATASQTHSLKNEAEELRAKISSYENEIIALKESNARLSQDLASSMNNKAKDEELNKLKLQFAAFEKASAELKDDLLKRNMIIEELNQEISKRDGELSKYKKNGEELLRTAQTVDELRAALNAKEDAIRCLTVDIDNYKKQVSLIDELQASIEKKDKIISSNNVQLEESVNLKQKVDQLMAEIKNKENAIANHASEKAEWEKKEKKITEEYHSVKNLLDELNGEISKFSEYKKQQESIVEELRNKEKEYLKKQEDDSKYVFIEKNSEEEPVEKEIEEVFVLKKNNEDFAAPSSSTNEELEKIKEDNSKLKSKVEELRARNFAILEKVEASGMISQSSSSNDTMQEERRNVVNTLKPIFNKSCDNLGDDNVYTKWLKEAVETVKKSLSENKSQKSTKPMKSNHDSEVDTTVYRLALESLLNELNVIQDLAAQQASKYENTIADLKSNAN